MRTKEIPELWTLRNSLNSKKIVVNFEHQNKVKKANGPSHVKTIPPINRELFWEDFRCSWREILSAMPLTTIFYKCTFHTLDQSTLEASRTPVSERMLTATLL